VIDSFGVVEIIMLIEERFGIEFDFDELPADDLTRIGPLSQYVERKSAEQ
jgi:acyl carrier protein